MNIEVNELDELLNYLETTSLEPHDNYTSEFTYKDQNILYKYIKDLQQERDKYKSIVDEATKYNDYLKEHCKYRLNEGHLRKMKKILGGKNEEN